MIALLLAAALLAQDGRRIPIKWRDGAEETVELLEHDARGMKVRVTGVAYPVWVPFADLDPRTAEATRRQLGGAVPAAAPSGGLTVPGLRLELDSGLVEGVELPSADPALLRLQTAAGVREIPRKEVRRTEAAHLDLRAIYTVEEIVAQFRERFHPATPEQWAAMAAELARAGLGDRALKALRIVAILKEPRGPERGLMEALGRLSAGLSDAEARGAAGRLQEACVTGDYDAALEQLGVIERRPAGEAAAEEWRRVKAEIVVLRGASGEARLQAEWGRAIELELMRLATAPAIGAAEADRFVSEQLMKEAGAKVAERLGYTRGDPAVTEAWGRRPSGARLIHSYGPSTLLLEAAAPTAEEWWGRAAPEERMNYLKGRHIERDREVVRREQKNCPSCGARGTVRGGGAGAPVVCPGCSGARAWRVLVYR